MNLKNNNRNISINDLGKFININGWVHKYRNLKNIIFIDLRTNEGIIQIVIDQTYFWVFNLAKQLRLEFCINVQGYVKKKDFNQIEIFATNIKIINMSKNLPFSIFNKYTNEDIRLKYRYLDLRSFYMLNNLKQRAKIINFLRNFLIKHKFIEVETPILSNPNPEGARDYLVPSRIHKNKFYALPQSPQLYKQLLMISGFDRYYQIAKCFRDEDVRADRQPEFTQLDIEISFLPSNKLRTLIEIMLKTLWMKIKQKKLDTFKIISYNKAIAKYATDKPDLRNPLYFININSLIKPYLNLLFPDYQNKEDLNSMIICINNQYNDILKRKFDRYQIFFNQNKILFFCCIDINNIFDQKYKIFPSNIDIDKFFIVNLINKLNIKNKDIIVIIIDKFTTLNLILNKFRTLIARDLNLINYNEDKAAWIIHSPLFKINNEQKLESNHHPFTAPLNKFSITDLLNKPKKILADDYDLIINGYEIGGGSVRNHLINIQIEIFNLLGISKHEQNKQFGFLLEALQYGAPFHAGIALGIDRLVMIIMNLTNIRDVIAFPKTTNLSCLLTNAPILADMIKIKKLYFNK